jgi:hypothetical protein
VVQADQLLDPEVVADAVADVEVAVVEAPGDDEAFDDEDHCVSGGTGDASPPEAARSVETADALVNADDFEAHGGVGIVPAVAAEVLVAVDDGDDVETHEVKNPGLAEVNALMQS